MGQTDLFHPPRPLPAVVRKKARRLATSSLDALDHGSSTRAVVRAKVLAEIKGAGPIGRTRQEIAARTGIALESVCPSVAYLRDVSREVFEPVRDHKKDGRPIHHRREGRNLVCAILYESTWQTPQHRAG